MKVALALVAMAALAAAPAPRRVASLNLCTDELALLLAAPGQLVSVSRLGADPEETPLAARAHGIARNNGRMEDVAGLAPGLVLTSGGVGGAYAAEIAARLHTHVVALPYATTIDGTRANIRQVAAALGRPVEGEALVARMDADLGAVPAALEPALMIGGGGVAPGADGLAAALLRHAGLLQLSGSATRSLEGLLIAPPRVLLLSRYRAGEMSLNAAWLQHPALSRLPASVRRVETDGRAWTCMGPPAAAEVARLRRALGASR